MKIILPVLKFEKESHCLCLQLPPWRWLSPRGFCQILDASLYVGLQQLPETVKLSSKQKLSYIQLALLSFLSHN